MPVFSIDTSLLDDGLKPKTVNSEEKSRAEEKLTFLKACFSWLLKRSEKKPVNGEAVNTLYLIRYN